MIQIPIRKDTTLEDAVERAPETMSVFSVILKKKKQTDVISSSTFERRCLKIAIKAIERQRLFRLTRNVENYGQIKR